MSEIRQAVESFLPMSYPGHTELPFHGIRHPYQVAEDSTRFIERIESEGKYISKVEVT
jgi:hypothetical protein